MFCWNPPLLYRVLDVHVLDPERPAIGVTQDMEDLIEGGDLAPGQAVGHELAWQVPNGESVGERVEFGVDVRWLHV